MPEFDRTEPVTLSLRLHRGSAEVFAADTDRIRVAVAGPDGSDLSDRYTIALDGSTLVVHAPDTHGWNWRSQPRARVTIHLPAGSKAHVRAASADIALAGTYAEAHAETASGALRADEITGNAHLKSASGSVTTGRVGGALAVSSSSGDLDLGDVTGDVTARTASGHITTGHVGGSLRAGTASGRITVAGVTRGDTRLKSSSGDITVGVTAGTGVWLDLDTASGRTSTDLAMGDSGGGTVETATLKLHARTASGNIDVHRTSGPVTVAA